jgi:hypothetical protein|nr:hypothetical protein [Neorhizobium tomejilense]
MDIVELIKTAKIGRERKEAQIDTCAPFAAALYDVLLENGFSPSLVTVGYRAGGLRNTWYHSVVKCDDVMYDSLGEFSTEIIRARLRIHPSVMYELTFTPDYREGCYDEEDYSVLYEFLVDELRKSAKRLAPPAAKAQPAATFCP